MTGFFISYLHAMQYSVLYDYVDSVEKQLKQKEIANENLQNQLYEAINVIKLLQQKREQDKALIYQQAALIQFLQEKERKRRAGIYITCSDSAPKRSYFKEKTA